MTITPVSARRQQQLPRDHHEDKKSTKADVSNEPIEDETLYPRCEFYHRFDNTSLFANDVQRANVYSRSDKARHIQGNRDETKFVPTLLTDPHAKVTNSLSAHTGGYANPYVLPKYANNIELKKHEFEPKYAAPVQAELYEELLSYKLGLCNYVAKEFTKQIPCADIGAGRYRAKIMASIPTLTSFKKVEIIIRKWQCQKKTCVELYTVVNGKVTKISLADNKKLVGQLAEQKVKSGDQLERVLEKFQPYLESKDLYPDLDRQGVHCSNKYPCVLVKFTPKVDDKSISEAAADKTFYKRYNHLLMAYFIAIVDYNAYNAGLEIEMVGRSGFGQNNPSISVTEKSFRINIGLVPKEYANVIVKSLVQLHNLFHLLEDADEHLEMNENLKDKLDNARQIGFEKLTLPNTYWEALWEKGSHGRNGCIFLHELIKRERDRPELLANFVLEAIKKNPDKFFTNLALAEAPLEEMFRLVEYTSDAQLKYEVHTSKSNAFINLKGLTNGIYKTRDNKYFQVINARNPKIKKLELKNSKQDMSAYKSDQKLSHERCTQLFKSYISPDPCKISVRSKSKLEEQKFFRFTEPSDKEVSSDPALSAIIGKLCHGIAVDVPKDLKVRDLYRFLEASHIDFICKKRTRTERDLKKVSDWGSESETEEPNFAQAKSVYAKKVIVANGMLAINLSYYAARSAIHFLDAVDEMDDDDDVYTVFENHHDEMALKSRKISINCTNTYFETISGDAKEPLCLDVATHPPSLRKDDKADILFFDLNSFRADFISQKANLHEQLKIAKPTVVILDHTSSATAEIRKAIKAIYEGHPTVSLVLLVTSGLKNEQGGADNNPYGKLTILSLADQGETNTLTNFIYDEIIALRSPDAGIKLSEKALLPKAAHAIRQSYKDRGFATTASAILRGDVEDSFDIETQSETLSESSSDDDVVNMETVVYVLTLKDIKDNYPDEFENLVNMGCSSREIFNLYKASEEKFKDMSDDRVLNLITDCDDLDLFETLSDIYDEDEACFWNILDDEDDLVCHHGIDEVYSTYQTVVKKYGYEDLYYDVDILDLVNRKLNSTYYDSESSHSDSVSGSSTEEYSDESYDDSYTATSSSEG